MLKINEIKLPLDSDESELLTLAAKALRCPKRKITGIEIAKKAVDSRKKDDIYFVYNVNVTVDGDEVRLTPIEYNILLYLVENRGRVFTSGQIYEAVWDEDAIGSDNIIAVHIRHIREKIEINPKEPRYLKVVWGQGYKIEKL